MTTYTSDAHFTNTSYEGPRVRAITLGMGISGGHNVHRVSIFRTGKPPGPNGRRLAVVPQNFGGLSTSLLTTIGPANGDIYGLLEAGWDVALFTTPVCRASPDDSPELGQSGFPAVGTSTTLWSPSDGLYGPAYEGNGFVVPPGVIPSNYALGSVVPFERAQRFNLAQAMCMLTQWLVAKRSVIKYDPAWLDLHARSMAAWACAWVFWGPDRQPQTFPGGVGQDAVSTAGVYRKLACRSMPALFKALHQLNAGNDFKGTFFPKVEVAPGGPAAGYDKPCIDLAATDAAWQDALSPLLFVQADGALVDNAKKGAWLAYGDADDFGPPWDQTHPGTSAVGLHALHSSWFMVALELVLGSALDSVLTAIGATTGTHDRDITDGPSQTQDLITFLLKPQPDGTGGGPGGGDGPIVTPLQAQAKSAVFVIDVVQFVDLLDLDLVATYRYAASDVEIHHGGATYPGVPAIELRLAANTISLDGEVSTITLPEDDFLLALSSGEPQPKTMILVREILEVPGSPLSRVVLTHLVGRVRQATRNPGGRRGVVALEAAPTKSDLDTPSGLQATPGCSWTFGDPLTCTVALGPLRQTGTVDTIAGATVIIDGLQVPSGFARYFHRGTVELGGVRLTVREWDPKFPSSFNLVRPPPAAWAGADVLVTPGCRKLIDACREWFNEPRFLGLGYGIPAYDPLLDKPE